MIALTVVSVALVVGVYALTAYHGTDVTRFERAKYAGLVGLFHFVLMFGARVVFPTPHGFVWEIYWYVLMALAVLMVLEAVVVSRGLSVRTEDGDYIPVTPVKRVRFARHAWVCALVTAPIVSVLYSGPYLNQRVGGAIGVVRHDPVPQLSTPTLPEKQARMTAQLVLDRTNKEIQSGFGLGDGFPQHRNGRLEYLYPVEFGSSIHAMSTDNTPGYIAVWGTVPGSEATLVNTSTDGRAIELRFIPSAIGATDLGRSIRAIHPDARIAKPRFMVDKTGWPFWVTAVISQTTFGNGLDVAGVIALDAVTGRIIRYDSPTRPDWLRVVVPEEVARERINWYAFYSKSQRNFLERILYELNPLDGVHLEERYDAEGWAYWVGNRKGLAAKEPQFVMSALGGTLWERTTAQQAQR